MRNVRRRRGSAVAHTRGGGGASRPLATRSVRVREPAPAAAGRAPPPRPASSPPAWCSAGTAPPMRRRRHPPAARSGTSPTTPKAASRRAPEPAHTGARAAERVAAPATPATTDGAPSLAPLTGSSNSRGASSAWPWPWPPPPRARSRVGRAIALSHAAMSWVCVWGSVCWCRSCVVGRCAADVTPLAPTTSEASCAVATPRHARLARPAVLHANAPPVRAALPPLALSRPP